MLSAKMGGVILNNVKVIWGDYSQIKTELLLFKTALNYPINFDYFHLLSGVDLPIKPVDEIHAFFEKNKGFEFLEADNREKDKAQIDRKTNYYRILSCFGRPRHKVCRGILKKCNILILGVQKNILGVNRGRKNPFPFYRGTNWCDLSREAVSFLVAKECYIRRRFRFTICADEIYKHSLLMNSPFRDKVYVAENNQRRCLRLIDWKRGAPYTWTIDDVEEIMCSRNLFARKFSSCHKEIIDYISEHV